MRKLKYVKLFEIFNTESFTTGGDFIYLTSVASGVSRKLRVDSVTRYGYNQCKIDCTEFAAIFSRQQPAEDLEKPSKFPDTFSFVVTFSAGADPKVEIIHKYGKSDWDKSSDEYRFDMLPEI